MVQTLTLLFHTEPFNQFPIHIPECEESINTTDCGKEPSEVYTYDSATKTCIKAEWNGCETKNKFDDEESCHKACGGDNWEDKIKKLPMEDVKEIDKILDDIIEENDKEVKEIDAAEEEQDDGQPDADEEPEDSEVPEAVLLKHVTKVYDLETTEHNEEAITTPEGITTTEAATEEPTEVPTTTEDEAGPAEEIVTT